MLVEIDAASALPPFDQIRTQVIARIERGDLVAGAKLPTVRALADELGLAANTVAKAYRALEQAGFIETRGRAGTLVRARGGDAEQAAQDAARAYADRIRELGVGPVAAVALAAAALGAATD